jgi:hypothetical protein
MQNAEFEVKKSLQMKPHLIVLLKPEPHGNSKQNQQGLEQREGSDQLGDNLVEGSICAEYFEEYEHCWSFDKQPKTD